MLGTRNLSMSLFLNGNDSDNGIEEKGQEMKTIEAASEVTSAGNTTGVMQGGLRTNPREIRQLRGLYGEGYFGLGSGQLKSAFAADINVVQQVSEEAVLKLRLAVELQDKQRNYRYYNYSDTDQQDELHLLFGREMAQFPNIKLAVEAINALIAELETSK